MCKIKSAKIQHISLQHVDDGRDRRIASAFPLGKRQCHPREPWNAEWKAAKLRGRENYIWLFEWRVACAAEAENMHTLKCWQKGSSAGATSIENYRYVNGYKTARTQREKTQHRRQGMHNTYQILITKKLWREDLDTRIHQIDYITFCWLSVSLIK